MPLVTTSTYTPPLLLRQADMQTIFPVFFRPDPIAQCERERLELPDGDFVDLDWCTGNRGARPLVIVSHGLEGHSGRKYVRGMLRAALDSGFDAMARNFRGCSGEMNRLPQMYHSGETKDLHEVICHAARQYDEIYLTGFSMGGNQTLKYLGEAPERVPSQVKGAACYSVPCDLVSSAHRISEARNRIYLKYFLISLNRKMVEKSSRFPRLFDTSNMNAIRRFEDFDERFTAPLHGFDSAQDYYRKASSLPHLHNIQVPTLLVNAANDPFLTPPCYPLDVARQSRHFTLEVPQMGGHVGFPSINPVNRYWSEERAMNFFRQ